MRLALFGVGFITACTAGSQDPQGTVHLPPNHGIHPIQHVPGGGQAMLFGGGGSFTFIGPTAPGTATYTDAPAFDPNGPGPSAPGTGAMNVTINGTNFTSAALETVALTFSDPMAGDYVALDGYMTYPGPGGDYANEITVIVPRSDFALGVPIALDGNDRVALFANGPADANEPTLVGAAITGTVTFTAGDLGSMVSGTIAGDFGQIDYVPDPPPGGAITAGPYALAVTGPADVYCDGTLAGHEAAFAGVTLADLGLGNANVTIAAPSPDYVTITNAPGFAGDFELDALGDAPGLYAGFTTETGTGPEGTTFVGKYLVFDGSSATTMFVNGGAGGGYVTADEQGTCTVAFGASLTGP
jgi:hypothetical protein